MFARIARPWQAIEPVTLPACNETAAAIQPVASAKSEPLTLGRCPYADQRAVLFVVHVRVRGNARCPPPDKSERACWFRYHWQNKRIGINPASSGERVNRRTVYKYWNRPNETIPKVRTESQKGVFDMLVLSRKVKERIVIGGDIEVTVIDIRGDRVKLGFTGPPNVPIHREEVYRRIAEWTQNQTDNAVGAEL